MHTRQMIDHSVGSSNKVQLIGCINSTLILHSIPAMPCKQQEAYPDSLGSHTEPLTPGTKAILGATSSTVSGSPGFPANGFGTWHLSTELIPNGYKNPLLFVALQPQMSPNHSSTVTERILYECKCIDCLPSWRLFATNRDSKPVKRRLQANSRLLSLWAGTFVENISTVSPPNFNDFTNTVAIVEFAFNYSFVCWIKAPRGQRSRAGSINVFVRAEATSCWRSPEVRDGAKLVSSPDLIRRVYRIQYNPNPSFPARDTESDPRWGWFWVWDRGYY